jgi:osmotically-inducible protein OsmY
MNMSLFKSSVTAARDQMTVSSGTTSKSRMRLCALFCAAILASAASVRPTYASCGFAGCPGDSAITADVQASLNQHPILNLLHVKTLNGVVYLSGTVSSGFQREIAESVAHQVQGVTRVVNSISLSK